MRNLLTRQTVLTLITLLLASLLTTTALAQDVAPGKTDTPQATLNITTTSPAEPTREQQTGRKAANSEKPDPNAPPPLLPNKAFYASLKAIDGQDFSFSDLQGKVLVIDLWATWCGPCRYATPELVKLQRDFENDVEIIGLDIDPRSDTLADVRAYIKEFKINYKVAFADEELARSLMKGGNIPQSLVISRDGHIIKHFIGFSPDRTPALLRETIEKALQ